RLWQSLPIVPGVRSAAVFMTLLLGRVPTVCHTCAFVDRSTLFTLSCGGSLIFALTAALATVLRRCAPPERHAITAAIAVSSLLLSGTSCSNAQQAVAVVPILTGQTMLCPRVAKRSSQCPSPLN